MSLAMTCAFGKAPAKQDNRTIKLKDILLAADVLLAGDPLPAEYDFDDQHKGIPLHTYQNPPKNNCVIAGRAHQTLRFETVEQDRLINITDDDVDVEYKKQAGPDEKKEIETLNSLKLWRKRGWQAAGQHLGILAFAKLDLDDHEQIKRMIYINLGVGLGFDLPESAITQFKNRQPWKVTKDRAANHGHYVYVSGYTQDGPVCVTWGRKQQMSWAFVDKYSDEAYVIIDALNTPEKRRIFDEGKINNCLARCAQMLGKTD